VVSFWREEGASEEGVGSNDPPRSAAAKPLPPGGFCSCRSGESEVKFILWEDSLVTGSSCGAIAIPRVVTLEEEKEEEEEWVLVAATGFKEALGPRDFAVSSFEKTFFTPLLEKLWASVGRGGIADGALDPRLALLFLLGFTPPIAA